MIVIGVDFHPELQQIALVDTDSGELEERRPPALGCHRQFLELNLGLQREIGIGGIWQPEPPIEYQLKSLGSFGFDVRNPEPECRLLCRCHFVFHKRAHSVR